MHELYSRGEGLKNKHLLNTSIKANDGAYTITVS